MTEASGEEQSPDWGRPKTSVRAYLISAFAVICFLAGLFVSQPLIFVSIPLILLVALMLLQSRDPRPRVLVERATEKVRIREGDTTRVRLRIRNLDARAVPLLQLRDEVDPDLFGKRTRSSFSSSLKAGEVKDFYYEVSGNDFGVHTLGPITLRAQDSTGLFESRAELVLYSKLVVFPESTERLGHLAIRPRKTKPWPGEILARRSGSGMDYYSVRRFMTGDPVKHINWRASAKQAQTSDEPLVNEFLAEVGAEILIVVDAGRAREIRAERDLPLMHSVKAAISIAERLLHDRNRVGLLTTGANPRRVPTGYGKRQFERIGAALLQLQPGDSDFRWWVECSIHMFFPKISQIIFVSSLMDADSISAAAELARNGQRDVIVVSPDPIELASAQQGRRNARERRIALRLAALERAKDIGLLRSANILVIDWKTSSSLEEVMQVHGRVLSRYAAISARRR